MGAFHNILSLFFMYKFLTLRFLKIKPKFLGSGNSFFWGGGEHKLKHYLFLLIFLPLRNTQLFKSFELIIKQKTNCINTTFSSIFILKILCFRLQHILLDLLFSSIDSLCKSLRFQNIILSAFAYNCSPFEKQLWSTTGSW